MIPSPEQPIDYRLVNAGQYLRNMFPNNRSSWHVSKSSQPQRLATTTLINKQLRNIRDRFLSSAEKDEIINFPEIRFEKDNSINSAPKGPLMRDFLSNITSGRVAIIIDEGKIADESCAFAVELKQFQDNYQHLTGIEIHFPQNFATLMINVDSVLEQMITVAGATDLKIEALKLPRHEGNYTPFNNDQGKFVLGYLKEDGKLHIFHRRIDPKKTYDLIKKAQP